MLEAPLLDELMPEDDEPVRCDDGFMPLQALNAAIQMTEKISFFMETSIDDSSGTAIFFDLPYYL